MNITACGPQVNHVTISDHRSERSGSRYTFTINPINVITHVKPYNAHFDKKL